MEQMERLENVGPVGGLKVGLGESPELDDVSIDPAPGRHGTYHSGLRILREFISRDSYTASHCERVADYAMAIAGSFNLTAERLEALRVAAHVHDVGKLDISRDLLYKSAQLTPDEYDAMQQHVPIGAEIVELVGGAMLRVVPIVLAHHDKFDGSGLFPTRGNDIPLEARILSVADVYDSLTSDRPYRSAMPAYSARYVVRQGAGTDFDPLVVTAFENAFDRGVLEPAAARSVA